MGCSNVYLLASEGYHKVGFSKNIIARIQELQTGNPHRIIYVDSFKTDWPLQDEKAIHSYLYGYRCRGEWFDIPNEVLINRAAWFRSTYADKKRRDRLCNMEQLTINNVKPSLLIESLPY